MSLYSSLAPKGVTGLGYASTAEQVTAGLALTGRTILVTGCNSGLGYETMRVLAMRGAHVIGTARTAGKAQHACASLAGRATPLVCELSEPASVRACAQALRAQASRDGSKLDAIICNAGIMGVPKLRLACGYELQFFTNHIGHFILVNELLDMLADDGRVIVLSSEAHRRAPAAGIEFDNLSGAKGYRPFSAYAQSKFANLLFAKELARRLAGSHKTANAVHPGVIRTAIGRNLPAVAEKVFFGIGSLLFLKNIAQGAATQCYAAVHPAAAAISGAYLADCRVKDPRPDANDPALARRLWELSSQIAARL